MTGGLMAKCKRKYGERQRVYTPKYGHTCFSISPLPPTMMREKNKTEKTAGNLKSDYDEMWFQN
jgi:hypothetical protein